MKRYAFAGGLLLAGCTVAPEGAAVVVARAAAETCTASVFSEGSRLADGSAWSHRRSVAEPLAAHRTHALGSRVRVTRLDTGTSIVVPVRDRGPFIRGRCIDLSIGAANALRFSGLARVRVEAVK